MNLYEKYYRIDQQLGRIREELWCVVNKKLYEQKQAELVGLLNKKEKLIELIQQGVGDNKNDVINVMQL